MNRLLASCALLLMTSQNTLAQVYDAETIRLASQYWDEAHAGPTCAQALTLRRAHLRWLRGLGLARRTIYSFRHHHNRLAGRIDSDPTLQSLVDGTLFGQETKPLLLTGRISDGKTMHLHTLEKFLTASGRPFVSLTDGSHQLGDHEDTIVLNLTVRSSSALQQALVQTTTRWHVTDGLRFRQQYLAAGILDFLEQNRHALRDVIVIVDPSILYPEKKTKATLPTTLNLLDRVAWLRGNAGIFFVVAVNTDFLEELPQLAAIQGTDPDVLTEYRRLSLEPSFAADGRFDKLKALFPGQSLRDIRFILLKHARK